jgi:hypothetical protein
MKIIFSLLLFSAVSASAAITISGTAVTNARNFGAAANIPTGSLVLLIVDTGNNGFFNLGSPTGNTSVTTDPQILSSNANLGVGSTFGGETIIGRIASGSGSVSGLLTNFDATAYLGMSFAVVWFDGLTAAGAETNAANGTHWGVVRGSDWVFPAANSGTFTHASDDSGGAATYYQTNVNAPAAGAVAFRTNGAAFTIGVIPEPSTALLGAIGALGLLRRRR